MVARVEKYPPAAVQEEGAGEEEDEGQEEVAEQAAGEEEDEDDKRKRKRSESPHSPSEDEWIGRTINGYRIVKRVGKGSFGTCYCGQSVKDSSDEICLKIENEEKVKPKLSLEYAALRAVERKHKARSTGQLCVPLAFRVLQNSPVNILMQSLLGPSLEDLFQNCDKKLDIASTLYLAPMILSAMEQVHRAGIIHRDIKPHNFLLGTGKDADRVFLVDFGLSRYYKDEKTKLHKPFKLGRHLVGTVRYVGLNIHRGYEASRRDDLESIGYMFVYFMAGRLPWQGMGSKKDKEKRNKLIHASKESTRLSSLCNDLPQAFQQFLRYAKGLEYEEKPDYPYLQRLFREQMVNTCGNIEPSQLLWRRKGIYPKKSWEAPPAAATPPRPKGAAAPATPPTAAAPARAAALAAPSTVGGSKPSSHPSRSRASDEPPTPPTPVVTQSRG